MVQGMAETRKCKDGCGRLVTGNRKFSEVCRPPRGRATAPEPPAPVVGESEFVSTIRAELQRLGKLQSIDGAHLLQIAGRMETATGAAYAALSRQFSLKLEEVAPAQVGASGGAPVTPMDNLEARRAAKRAAAGG